MLESRMGSDAGEYGKELSTKAAGRVLPVLIRLLSFACVELC